MKTLYVEFIKIFDLNWIENHLLYFSAVGGAIILYLFIKIIVKIDKDLKNYKRKRNDSLVDYMRKTSKYNNDNKKNKLTFDEKD
jgi:hypothetical protein